MIGIIEDEFQKEVLECEIPVLVCFTTRWCHSCYPACLLADELAKGYEGKVKFVRMDIEKSPDIAERCRIAVVPTFLLFFNSQMVSKLAGFHYLQPMQSLLNSLVGAKGVKDMVQTKESEALRNRSEAIVSKANSGVEIKIRTMKICDFNVCYSIDQEIRANEKVFTYASITAKDIFENIEDLEHFAFPISYVDFIKRDISGQVKLGLVAEVEGEVRGFILGRIEHTDKEPTKLGEISILGVAPSYRRMGIATELVEAICKRFEEKDVETVSVLLDQRDKDLLGVFKRMGFKARHLLEYYKPVNNMEVKQRC
jgi:thioredoxin 1